MALHLDHAVVALPIIVSLGIFAQWIASRLQIPAILPLLIIGFIIGPSTHILNPTDALGKEGLSVMTSLAIALILFEGGLTLRFADIAGHGRAVTNLISTGALTTWVLAAIAAHLITGLSWEVSALFGALVIVTGPTVIAPLLRIIRPNATIGGVLRWEGILIDPIGALAAALAFEWVRADTDSGALSATISHMASFIGVGTAIGLVMGGLLVAALRRDWLPDHLINPGVLAWVLLAFGLSDVFAPESGLLSVTIMGVLLANANLSQIAEVLHFKEELVVILLSTIFVALAANISTEALLAVFQPAPMLLLASIILLVRPISVMVSSIGTNLSTPERMFISYVGPRGIVAAAISALFAQRLQDLGVAGGDQLVTLVFAVIVGTVILASLTAKPVAKLLHVVEAEPTGYLMIGAHPLSRSIARVLHEEGVQVLLVDTNASNIRQAKLEGLQTYYGNVLSSGADELSLEGIGNLLALTSNDEANTLSVRRYARQFGRKNVYQLRPRKEDGRMALKESVRGVTAFKRKPSYTDLEQYSRQNWRVRRTKLTESYTLADFRNDQPDALILFVGTEGVFQVTSDPDIPSKNVTIISLGPENVSRLQTGQTGQLNRSGQVQTVQSIQTSQLSQMNRSQKQSKQSKQKSAHTKNDQDDKS